jgi:hypothetical protein
MSYLLVQVASSLWAWEVIYSEQTAKQSWSRPLNPSTVILSQVGSVLNKDQDQFCNFECLLNRPYGAGTIKLASFHIFPRHFENWNVCAGSEHSSDVADRDLGARARERTSGRARTQLRDREREQYRETEQYRERDQYRETEPYREREYRERDRDFGEIVFLEREGEMLAHFQASSSGLTRQQQGLTYGNSAKTTWKTYAAKLSNFAGLPIFYISTKCARNR